MHYIQATVFTCAAMLFIICAFVQRSDVLFENGSIQQFLVRSNPKVENQRFDLKKKINQILRFRSQKWVFNKPLEMRIRGKKDQAATNKQNEEQRISNERLSNMTQILFYNSDVRFFCEVCKLNVR